MTEAVRSPPKERDAAQIALAKAIVEQITALNRSIAQANKLGIQIRLQLCGVNCTPEITDIYVVRGEKALKIYDEVMK